MGRKTPLALRIDPELLARVDVARGDVSRTRWVERALERALGDVAVVSGGDTGEQSPGGSTPRPSASPRASEKSDSRGYEKIPPGSEPRSRQAPSIRDTWAR